MKLWVVQGGDVAKGRVKGNQLGDFEGAHVELSCLKTLARREPGQQGARLDLDRWSC